MLSKSFNQSLWILVILCITLSRCDVLVGGHREADEDDLAAARPLLLDSLDQLKGQQDGTELRLVKISRATVQVVAGKLYTIHTELASPDDSVKKTCKVTIWYQPWSGFRETKFECDDATKYKVTKTKRRKRSADGQVVGGPSNVEPETLEELRKNISESFGQLGADGDATKQLKLKEILGAQKKVVAGILYTINGMVETNEGLKACEIEVWEKPWIQFRKVTVKCENGQRFEVIKDNRPKRASKLMKPLLTESELNLPIVDGVDSTILFDQFKRSFERSYKDQEEEAMRFRIFQNNLFLIQQLNKFEMGTAQYGVTEFTDMTEKEYKQRTGLLVDAQRSANEIPNAFADIPDIDLPEAHDWRQYNAVTPVKNQGNCGSCWAFSVTGNIEGLYAIQRGKLESFSEQELVDCDTTDAGCNGGLPDNAVKYLENYGLESENDYPYTAHKEKCHFNQSLARVQVTGVIDFKEKDEIGMAKWLVQNGPISIGINANAMQFYRGGISHPWKALCRSSGIDHGVLIVGFGVSNYPVLNKTVPYWTIKNSWGGRWGEQGYYRIYRGDNSCGVSSMASSAVLSKRIDNFA